MKKFIIYKTDNSMLENCILDVIKEDNETVTLSYNDINDVKEITVSLTDGEFYTDEVIQRRKKELAIRNVLSLMDYNNITIEDIKQEINL